MVDDVVRQDHLQAVQRGVEVVIGFNVLLSDVRRPHAFEERAAFLRQFAFQETGQDYRLFAVRAAEASEGALKFALRIFPRLFAHNQDENRALVYKFVKGFLRAAHCDCPELRFRAVPYDLRVHALVDSVQHFNEGRKQKPLHLKFPDGGRDENRNFRHINPRLPVLSTCPVYGNAAGLSSDGGRKTPPRMRVAIVGKLRGA